MSLERWEQNGWLRSHATSADEIDAVFALVERDLADAAREEISTDWRFNIAYNAGLQLATVVLYAGGYRTGKGQSKHYRTIQAVPLAMGERFLGICAYLDSCRRKRNMSEYDAAGTISEKEAEDLLEAVRDFKVDVEKWLREKVPDLI